MMAAWGFAVALVVLVVAISLGLAGPDTSPVDPGPFIGGRGGGPE
jgi:hypothetical protein